VAQRSVLGHRALTPGWGVTDHNMCFVYHFISTGGPWASHGHSCHLKGKWTQSFYLPNISKC
jgi:hypothetical protein